MGRLVKSRKLIGGRKTKSAKLRTTNKAHSRKLPQSTIEAIIAYSSGKSTTEKYWRDLGPEYGWDTEAKIKREANLHQRYERELRNELEGHRYAFTPDEVEYVGSGTMGRCLGNAIRANKNDPSMEIYYGHVINKIGRQKYATLEHFWNVKDGVVYEYTDLGHRRDFVYYAGNPITSKEARKQRASGEWK